MKKQRLLYLALVGSIVLSAAAVAPAADAVRRVSGSAVNGNVTRMTATDVTVEKTLGGGVDTVALPDIEEIVFDKEPAGMKTVRSNVRDENYDAANAAVEKIPTAGITRQELLDDIQFYRALCQSKLALTGGADITKAGAALFEFANKHPTNIHHFQANEVLGELFVATGKLDQARAAYAAVEKAPFPEYKARALIAQGKILVMEKKSAEALKAFQAVIGMSGQKGVTEGQKQAATLGTAQCLAETGKADEAIKVATDVIQLADSENTQLMADAYVTLGKAQLAKGDKKQALLAFLHVDVLFFANPQAHAEALKNLVVLWNELGKPDRATLAAQTLNSRYGGASGK